MKEKTLMSYQCVGVRLQLVCAKIYDDRKRTVVVRYLVKKNRRILNSSSDEYVMRKEFYRHVYIYAMSLPLFNN